MSVDALHGRRRSRRASSALEERGKLASDGEPVEEPVLCGVLGPGTLLGPGTSPGFGTVDADELLLIEPEAVGVGRGSTCRCVAGVG